MKRRKIDLDERVGIASLLCDVILLVRLFLILYSVSRLIFRWKFKTLVEDSEEYLVGVLFNDLNGRIAKY